MVRRREPVDVILREIKAYAIDINVVLLYASSRRGGAYTQLVRVLLENGADPNFQSGRHHRTPITACVRNHRIAGACRILKLLLASGADPNDLATAATFIRPLIYLARKEFDDEGAAAMGRLLLEYGAKPISKEERFSDTVKPGWYAEFRHRCFVCFVAKRATERALSKQGLMHKDVIPLIGACVWATRLNVEWK